MTQDNLGRYMARAAKIPLLTPEDEIELSRIIRAWVTHPGYPNAVPSDIAEAAIEAKHRFMAANIRLVIHIAKKYQRQGLDLEDLIGEGTLGLSRAIDDFDASKGFKFSTYAYWWIRQSITRGLQNYGRTIRIPTHIYDTLKAARKVAEAEYNKHGRYPAPRAIGEAMFEQGKLKAPVNGAKGKDPKELAIQKLEAALAIARKPASLSYVIEGCEDVVELGSIIPCPLPQPDEVAAAVVLKERVHDFLERLPYSQRVIIEAHHGLDGGEPRSLPQVAVELGYTENEGRTLIRKRYRNGIKALQRQIAALAPDLMEA